MDYIAVFKRLMILPKQIIIPLDYFKLTVVE